MTGIHNERRGKARGGRSVRNSRGGAGPGRAWWPLLQRERRRPRGPGRTSLSTPGPGLTFNPGRAPVTEPAVCGISNQSPGPAGPLPRPRAEAFIHRETTAGRAPSSPALPSCVPAAHGRGRRLTPCLACSSASRCCRSASSSSSAMAQRGRAPTAPARPGQALLIHRRALECLAPVPPHGAATAPSGGRGQMAEVPVVPSPPHLSPAPCSSSSCRPNFWPRSLSLPCGSRLCQASDPTRSSVSPA